MRLGKLAPRHDPRTLKMAKYLTLPAAPPMTDWTLKVPEWPMYGNDTLGDCVCAGAGHLEQLWTANAGSMIEVPPAAVLAMYEQVGKYKPGDPSTDNGCDMLTACKWLRKVGIGHHKIAAFLSVTATDFAQVRSTVAIFGALYLGVALPNTAQNQKTWHVQRGAGADGTAGSWGGHCVPVVAYDPTGLTVVTWGALKRMTWEFMATYADEAYALLSPDWLSAAGVSPSNLNLTQLEADLAAL